MASLGKSAVKIMVVMLLLGAANSAHALGTLDLTAWTPEQGVTALDGTWEFYWQALLEPDDIAAGVSLPVNYIDVPGSWNNEIIAGKKLSGSGYATYRLLFEVDTSDKLALKLPRMMTAYRLYLNGEQAAASGVVGTDRASMSPQYLPQAVVFTPKQGENELIVQVSNFYHRSGGILESIVLGSGKQIMDQRFRSVAYELFAFGCLFTMGLYHLTIYFYRKKEVYPLYFGIFCLLVGIRTLIVGERFLIYLFPALNWEFVHKIQTLTYYLGVPAILKFFHAVFSDLYNAKVVKLAGFFSGFFTLLVIVTPVRVFSVINPVYQVFTFAVIAYLLHNSFRALHSREEGSALIIAGALALILTAINDILYLSIWLNDNRLAFLRSFVKTDNLSTTGQLIFLFALAVVMANKFSLAHQSEEEMVLHLDRLVHDRTMALAKSQRELEEANRTLRMISRKDPATGLWNRRYYDEVMEIEWSRCQRYERSIAMMIIDIDYFKNYNDCYGHLSGDDCLVTIAECLTNVFQRSTDLVVRYGGEEFVVVMPEQSFDQAMRMGELVCEKVKDLQIPHSCSPISSWVTVSIGVSALIPAETNSYQDLFEAADQALYEAKAAGRDQVRGIR